jgi:hypothetical protein
MNYERLFKAKKPISMLYVTQSTTKNQQHLLSHRSPTRLNSKCRAEHVLRQIVSRPLYKENGLGEEGIILYYAR